MTAKPPVAALVPKAEHWKSYGETEGDRLEVALVKHDGQPYVLFRDSHGATLAYDEREARAFTHGAIRGEFDINKAEH